MEQEILDIYHEAFPEVTPSCFQQDLLFTTVKDLARWRKTIVFWAGNDYRPQSIAKMLQYYTELGNGTNSTNGNGNRKRTDQDVIAESAEFYRDWQAREAGDLAN